MLSIDQVDARLDRGRATFVLVIPTGFQRRVLAGRAATLQLNVDATRMSQAFAGSGYIRAIALDEVAGFLGKAGPSHRRSAWPCGPVSTRRSRLPGSAA